MDRVYVLINKDVMPRRVWWNPFTWRVNHSHYAVQAAHALAELMSNYSNNPALYEWASSKKTLIVLEASSYEIDVLSKDNTYPHAIFVEAGPAVWGISAMAVGPLTREQARNLLGHLPLLRV